MLGALVIGGIAASTIASAISGYYGAKAQARAYEKLARATEAERVEFQRAYDQQYGPGSYNQQLQQIGQVAGQQFSDLINDTAAWDRYIGGEKAYTAPAEFTFTEADFTDDPSYKVRLQQGMDSLDQSNVSQGLNLSGAAARAMNDYAQNEASKEYSAAYNRAFGQYRDQRDFDYNAWKAESQQYYNNLLNQLNGLDKQAQRGVEANTSQGNALAALANNNAAAIQQQATAQGAADMARTSQWTSVLDSIAKGLTMGAGYGASQAGATPAPSNTTPVQNSDFTSQFMNGYDTNSQWSQPIYQQPTTQNLIGV